MTARNWSSLKVFRCLVSLRSAFVWLVLILLLAGAASYNHGSRYALVGHRPIQSVASQSVVPGRVEAAVAPREAASAQGDAATSASRMVRAVHQVSRYVYPESMAPGCCERRPAPRSEPAQLGMAAVEPPVVLQWQPGDGVCTGIVPAEPKLPALTALQLSISRT